MTAVARQHALAMHGMPDHEDASIRLAVEQTQSMRERYKAPHAYRGTPPKSRRRISMTLTPRLFKGHRV